VFQKALIGLFLLSLVGTAAHAIEGAPITLRDGLVWADVICPGRGTFHFVVDTGAACSCVNLRSARRLGLRLGPALVVAGVGGSATGYRCAGFQGTVGAMRLPGEVVALDLSGPARGCSQAIDGLIGADFFKGRVARIDYARGLLSRGASLPDGAAMQGRFENGVFCVPVAVNGSPARWTRLDTGCTDALDWCVAAGGGKRASPTVALAAFAKSRLRADVRVGGAEMPGLPVKLHSREIFPGEAGLLGNGALCRYTVTIDGITGRVALTSPDGK